jgi:hypothetical protein
MALELTRPDSLKERMKAKAREYARAKRGKLGAADRAETARSDQPADRPACRRDRGQRSADQGNHRLDQGHGDGAGRVAGTAPAARIWGQRDNPAASGDGGKSIETLADKLKRNPDDAACRMAFQTILDNITVHPTGKVSMHARLSAMAGCRSIPGAALASGNRCGRRASAYR